MAKVLARTIMADAEESSTVHPQMHLSRIQLNLLSLSFRELAWAYQFNSVLRHGWQTADKLCY